MKQSTSHDFSKNPTGEIRCDGEALSDKQLAAIELLAVGMPFKSVAESVQVDRRTIYTWRQDDEFQQALEVRRNELRTCAANRLHGMLEASLNVIEQRLSDRYEPTRFRAATTVLRLAGLHKQPAHRTMQ